MKRTVTCILTLSILFLNVCGTAWAVDTDTEAVLELDASAGILVTEDPADYPNQEVLVCYADGTFEVLTYKDETALATGLVALAENDAVTLIQPNYAYSTSDFSTDDALSAQQWALSNDGTFYMEEQKKQFPVHDAPFGIPAAPGQWTPLQNWGVPGGPSGSFRGRSYTALSSSNQVTAVAGIDINAEEAWAVYNGGIRDVVIALIDTGVDYTHEDLADAIWVNEDEIPGNGIDDDDNGYVDDVYGWNFYDNTNQVYVDAEDDSHGTHGAGTIAAQADNGVGIAGIVQSEHVKIMVLKVLGGSDGSGSTASIIQAIQYAEANGASICNLSLGSSTNDRALYQAMANSSMLFVVAAGNDGADTDAIPTYPASYALSNIISVANLNYDGILHYSSNYGAASVDLAAPGSYIISTTPENRYSYMTGTSMAAPMVTAAAAMVYSYYEDITLTDVKEILLSSVQTLNTLEGVTATGGMLDLGAAMTYSLSNLSGEGDEDETDDLIFTDVSSGTYYYDAVLWAVENGVAAGTSTNTFSPEASCTRAQMVTFLWRAAGSPEPETTENPFTDVDTSAYYYDAVLWAVENGIVVGATDTTFDPDSTVTRSQVATFLYRHAGSPEINGSNPFADVDTSAYYSDAVLWAANEGITAGTSTNAFGPDDDCIRAQTVTFLYRYMG